MNRSRSRGEGAARITYPPRPHVETDPAKIEALVRSRPFAHFFTADAEMSVTRIPFAIDADEGGVRGLRAHRALSPHEDGRAVGALMNRRLGG
ncbi:MAG: FMN-binding negative transcriptional regulator [Parvularculaceae bacterium]|nr:FMN-binding negative transcriptional regulator [Parvularculaceae bacterium]